MSNRPQAGPYYRTAPQQQLQTPPGPPFTAQDPMGHGGYYPTFFPAPNSNAPPVGHPSAHNVMHHFMLFSIHSSFIFIDRSMDRMKVFIHHIQQCLLEVDQWIELIIH